MLPFALLVMEIIILSFYPIDEEIREEMREEMVKEIQL
jgi:Na+/melibiose symporter-like transporter